MSAEESNAMMKTMMLQQSCNNVTADDTSSKGFRLIVDDPNDDECNCQLVRSLGAGRSTRVRVNNNMLMVDVLNIPTMSGGGLVTINFFYHIFSEGYESCHLILVSACCYHRRTGANHIRCKKQ